MKVIWDCVPVFFEIAGTAGHCLWGEGFIFGVSMTNDGRLLSRWFVTYYPTPAQQNVV